jgi:hypothetical protein
MSKEIRTAKSLLEGELSNFIGDPQRSALVRTLFGEEADYFAHKLIALANQIGAMHKTYEQDGKGDDAIVHLHYFRGGIDAWITEKDSVLGEPQHQAFGLVDLGQGFPEIGYVSIQELIDNGVELDLYWTPKTLGEVKRQHGIE